MDGNANVTAAINDFRNLVVHFTVRSKPCWKLGEIGEYNDKAIVLNIFVVSLAISHNYNTPGKGRMTL